MSLLASVMAQIIRAAGGPVETPWTPADVAGAIWLTGHEDGTVTTANGSVSEWRDNSGGVNDAAQATVGDRPTHSSADNSVDFGSDDWLGLPFPAFTEFSVFGVASGGAGAQAHITRKLADATWSWIIRFQNGTDLRLLSQHGGVNNDITYAGVGTAKSIFSAVASTAGLTTRYNGGDERVATTATGAVTTGAGDVGIGADPLNGLNNLVGSVWEIVLVPSAISAADARRMEGWLAHNNGLAGDLPVGHPYKNAAPTTAWTPADTTSALWLDAADETTITIDTGAVSEWADKSGNARHATQATPINRPSVAAAAIGGLNALQFSGNPEALATPSFTLTGLAAFAVANFGTATQSLIQTHRLGDPTNGWALYRSSVSGLVLRVNSATTQAVTAAAAETPVLIHGQAVSGGAKAVSVNGGALVAGTSGGTWVADSVDIGRDEGETTRYFNGTCGEIIILDSAPSTATRQRIEGYLAWKWGLQANLPPGHPYELAAPTIVGGPAAFPVIADSSTYGSTTFTTAHTPTAIASREAGDLLLTFVRGQRFDETLRAGYTRLFERVVSSNALAVFARVATADANDDTPVTWSGQSSRVSIIQLRVTDWFGSLDGVEGVDAAGLDCPNIPASWGSANNLFVTTASSNRGSIVFVPPSGYGDLINFQNVPGSTTTTSTSTIAVASKEAAEAADDPAVWTTSAGVVANTACGGVVVRPASA